MSTFVAVLGPRFKALLALLLPLIGGLATTAGASGDGQRTVSAIVTALVTGLIVHQVPNVSVDAVKADAPTDA